ncbi:transcriptional repressor NF-X1-like protein [Sarcoptes scabiei]|uniref:Transcriptional repressor NF-X1-like protein n=1 Tax=Sarcoptes scabiei TaxID=52283 RepID=A0A132AKG1_SARSC|nr:transcriptional repressor NF-X1-like protein [Sarcoptes scabiei]
MNRSDSQQNRRRGRGRGFASYQNNHHQNFQNRNAYPDLNYPQNRNRNFERNSQQSFRYYDDYNRNDRNHQRNSSNNYSVHSHDQNHNTDSNEKRYNYPNRSDQNRNDYKDSKNNDLPPRFRRNRAQTSRSQNSYQFGDNVNNAEDQKKRLTELRNTSENFTASFDGQNNHCQYDCENLNENRITRKRSDYNKGDSFHNSNLQNRNKPKSKIDINLESQREIMDDLLRKSKYECIVCCDHIRSFDSTWNCSSCFNIFHLKCIRQWAQKSTTDSNATSSSSSSEPRQTHQGDLNLNLASQLEFTTIQQSSSQSAPLNRNQSVGGMKWRCPTCQNIQNVIPKSYYCFCGKNLDPDLSNYYVPHSCGEVCSRPLDQFNPKVDEDFFVCEHRCTLRCHPGKCLPCSTKITRVCACTKTKIMMNCAARRSEIKCSNDCGKLLDCLNHRCEKKCHFGECQSCDKTFELKCFCGKRTKQSVRCSDMQNGWSCEEICSKPYDCGEHKCQKICHKDGCGSCPLSPDQIKSCCCGQTLLSDLISLNKQQPRKLCTDPIQTCGKICNKPLKCGDEENPHLCKAFCHEGPCPHCDQKTILRCFCGANSKMINCKEFESRNFSCKKKCNKKLSCGRHKCLKECCVNNDHICRQVCGRKLDCGQHNCQEQCHRNCSSCPNLIFTEIHCRCGGESLLPPLPCGTKPPTCQRPCSRDHGCDHIPNHSCHNDPECPPCVEFVERLCYGGHEIRTSIPCFETGVSCGRFCQKLLSCKVHKCVKICHDGDCPNCTQKCDRIRPDCSHPCRLPCHEDLKSDQCPKSPCLERIKIYCECEFYSKEVECDSILGPDEFQRQINSYLQRFQMNNSMSLAEIKEIVRNRLLHSLQCDQECSRQKRIKNFAEDLGIDPDQNRTIIIRYPNSLRNDARNNPKFVLNVHDKFVQLINSFKQSNQKTMSYNFPAMNRNNRETIHNYATFFGLKTESIDREPNRSVIVTATKTSTIPKQSVLQSIQINHDDLRPKQPSICRFKTASEEEKKIMLESVESEPEI